jgi:hypothetical protein
MAHALPITKLAGLFIKTLSKPLSKRIKHEFGRYQITQRILIGIGQTNHAVTSRLTIWSAGYRVRSITPLEPEQAMKEGAEFVGESIVFLVSGSVVVWEYNRSNEKARQKELKVREEERQKREALKAKLSALDKRLHALEEVVKSNSKFPITFGKHYVEPENIVPIVDDDDDDDDVELLPVTANVQPSPATSEASSTIKEQVQSVQTSSKESNAATLQKRLTKVNEEKSIWEWFVWRPW